MVLGAVAAQTLGIDSVRPWTQVYLGGRYFTVIGILRPVPLAPEIDEAALVGFPVANALLGLGGHPTELYLRVLPDQVRAVNNVLGFTANPPCPECVRLSTPSSILAARAGRLGSALTGLFLALGGIAAGVGGVGIANIMVISVLERRGEIGLRRALGATRWQVGPQFLVESVLLSAFGGVAGVLLGAGATAGYAVAAAQPHGGARRRGARRARDRARYRWPGRRLSRRQGGQAGPGGSPARHLVTWHARPAACAGDQQDGRDGQAARGDAQARLAVVEHGHEHASQAAGHVRHLVERFGHRERRGPDLVTDLAADDRVLAELGEAGAEDRRGHRR